MKLAEKQRSQYFSYYLLNYAYYYKAELHAVQIITDNKIGKRLT